jgi:hypothetical protein
MLGAVVMTVTMLPQLFRTLPLPAPLWVVSLAGLAQSAVLIGLAVWAGVALAGKVGLHAPAFEALAARQPLAPGLGPQLSPGLIAGFLGGMLLFAVNRSAPAAVAQLQEHFTPPLLARVLYGGFTEELLLRWGFMTVVIWLAWRLVQRRTSAPRAVYIWLGIVISAVMFGAGHLPAASMLVGKLTADVVIFVVVANSVFGVLFGYLFWRYGLEAAMIAHGFAHLVNYVAALLGHG